MRVLLILSVILFASCTDNDIYIYYCNKDCKENHQHNYKAKFDAEKWKDDTKKG